jgi:hypothetical protein
MGCMKGLVCYDGNKPFAGSVMEETSARRRGCHLHLLIRLIVAYALQGDCFRLIPLIRILRPLAVLRSSKQGDARDRY